MHSHAFGCPYQETTSGVLILVVMEDALAQLSYDIKGHMKGVLILVVMEDALAQYLQ